MTAKKHILVALLLPLAAAMLLWQRDAPTVAAKPDPTRATPSQSGTRPAPVPDIVAKPATAPPPVARSLSETLAKFNTTRSYRAFIYDLSRTGAAGEAIYAKNAVSLCVQARYFIRESSLANQQQHRALASLRGRCDMSDDELSSEFGALVRKSDEIEKLDVTSRDLIAAGSAYDRARTQGEERAAVAGLLATQDPIVMYRLAAPPTGPAGESRHFMGREHDFQPHTDFNHAFALASCEFGLDCGPDSPYTLMLCARHNWCAANYREALMIGLGGQSPRFAQVDALAAQLVQQIRQQHAGAFIRKR